MAVISPLQTLRKALAYGKPEWLSKMLVKKPDYITAAGCLKVARSRNNLRQESLFPEAIRTYNFLPNKLKDLPDREFSVKLKKWCKYNVPIKPP